VLTRIWFGFFLVAFCSAIYQWLVNGHAEIFALLVQSTFDMAKLAVEIALGLVGVLALWLGFFRIAEKSGLIQVLARLLSPLFHCLMPEVPRGHPAIGSVTMNLAANMLGLDNAATPMGLRAMQDLQRLNPQPDTATNAQILFLVLNTSSVTLIPVTIFLFRAQQGAADPTAVFLPILMATSASSLAGLLSVAWIQRIRIVDPVLLAYLGGAAVLMAAFAWSLMTLTPEVLAARSSLIGNLLLFSVIMLFLGMGMWRRIDVYDAFIEGAKEGFEVAVKIIPFLVGMLVAIGVLRVSGVLDGLLLGVQWSLNLLGVDTAFVQALPTAFMKPLSGSGARAMMLETMAMHGVDSFPALVAATVQGSTETTFYVLAVYFGSVGIRRVRHALACGLIADAAGITTAILLSYAFFR
jgi:spore maturation protein SpmA